MAPGGGAVGGPVEENLSVESTFVKPFVMKVCITLGCTSTQH